MPQRRWKVLFILPVLVGFFSCCPSRSSQDGRGQLFYGAGYSKKECRRVPALIPTI